MYIQYNHRLSTMKSAELKALKRLQCVTSSRTSQDLSEWTVQTSKQGLYYLHKPSELAFQTLGAATVALRAFALNRSTCTTSTYAHEADDAREEMLSMALSLDQVVAQMHKHLDALTQYRQAATAGKQKALQKQEPNIVDIYDVCRYVEVDKADIVLQQDDTLLQRSTKLRCQLLLATCAVFAQKLLHKSSYTSGYRQHCRFTLLQELKRTGADNPALSMLVEPLLPKPWRKELDKQKVLKGDEDTDLYSPQLAAQDMQTASAEEGAPMNDDFVVVESPEVLKLTCKVKQVAEALDLIPLYHRAHVESAVAEGLAEGLEAMSKCLKELEGQFAGQEHHQDWLHALNQALSDSNQGPQEVAPQMKS